MRRTAPSTQYLQAGASWLSTNQGCRNGVRLCHALDRCFSSQSSQPHSPHPAPTVHPVGSGTSILLKLILSRSPLSRGQELSMVSAARGRRCPWSALWTRPDPVSTVARRFCTMGSSGAPCVIRTKPLPLTPTCPLCQPQLSQLQ